MLVQEVKAKEPAAEKVPEAAAAAAEEKKGGDGGGGEEKKEDAPPPPPPPEEVVMRVFMHCEGCARKVKKILKGFDGNRATCSLLCLCAAQQQYCAVVFLVYFRFEREVGKLFFFPSFALIEYSLGIRLRF